MSGTVSNILPFSTTAQENTKAQSKNAAAGDFEALLSGMDRVQARALVDDFMDQLTGTSAKDKTAILEAASGTGGFDFTDAFEATFGTHGPLPTFIARVSAQLKLSPEQRASLQDIAVRNKDITKTSANVQKLAEELRQAGIG